jgi:hypothetical protein
MYLTIYFRNLKSMIKNMGGKKQLHLSCNLFETISKQASE